MPISRGQRLGNLKDIESASNSNKDKGLSAAVIDKQWPCATSYLPVDYWPALVVVGTWYLTVTMQFSKARRFSL